MKYKNSLTGIVAGLVLMTSFVINAAPNNSTSSSTDDTAKGQKTAGAHAAEKTTQSPDATHDFKQILAERNEFKKQCKEKGGIIDSLKDNIQKQNLTIAELQGKVQTREAVANSELRPVNAPGRNSKTLNDLILVTISAGCIILILSLLIVIRTRKKENVGIDYAKNFKDITDTITGLKKSLEEKIGNIPSIEAIGSNVMAKINDPSCKITQIIAALKKTIDTKTETPTFESIKKLFMDENERLHKGIETLAQQKVHVEDLQTSLARREIELKKNEDSFESMVKSACEQVRIETRNAERRAAEAEIAKLRGERDVATNRYNEFQSSLAEAEHRTAIAEAEAAKSEKRAFEAATQNYVTELGTVKQEIGSLEQQLRTAQQELIRQKTNFDAELKKRLEQQKNILESEGQAKIKATMEAEKVKFSSQVSLLQIDVDKKAGDIEEIRKRETVALDENQKLKTKISDQEMEVKLQKKALASQSEKLKDATLQVSTLKNSSDKLAAQVKNQEEEIKTLSTQNERIKKDISAAKETICELQASIYPPEFLDDSDFAQLKEHLDNWIIKKRPGGNVVKASLNLFSARTSVDSESWKLALRNIALGISMALREEKASSEIILKELLIWSKFVMKSADETYDFSLKLPNIGDTVDPSWMSAGSSRATKVSAVFSWAVWDNQFGVRHNAEVE